jgi:hypothetical protein
MAINPESVAKFRDDLLEERVDPNGGLYGSPGGQYH